VAPFRGAVRHNPLPLRPHQTRFPSVSEGNPNKHPAEIFTTQGVS
jgi:hypothetical protein